MTNESAKRSLAEIKEFLNGSVGFDFKCIDKLERNKWIEQVLVFHNYRNCHRIDKGYIRLYLQKISGLKRAHVNRLIQQFIKKGCIKKSDSDTKTKRHCFAKKYTGTDIKLLVETDNAHGRLSGPATSRILKREFFVYDKNQYENLKDISVSHIYYLRTVEKYTSDAMTFEKTNPTKVPIGERRRPEPNGKPGYLCVDSVHQGDSNGQKGIYHINITDAVTQFEFIGAVEAISEKFMKKILTDLIKQYPFVVYEVHSDNGSEYINKIIAELLNKLLIKQTKSRPRHSNDNGLAETKNGALIRKYIGYIYIGKQHADLVNDFYQKTFNEYINFHRPCGFATSQINNKGKEIKKYPKENYMTPYEKLKSLPSAEQYLKPGVTFAELDKIASAKSDTEFAKDMQLEKIKMLKIINANH